MVEIKLLGVCATPVKRKMAKGETNTEALLNAVLNSAKEEGDVQVDVLWLAEDGFKMGCDHCNFCVMKQTKESRICAKNDIMTTDYYTKVLEADALVISTPVYIGRASWLTYAFIDRLRALIEGKYYGFRSPLGGVLKDKVLGISSVAWFRHAGVETAMAFTAATMGLFFGMIPVGAGPIKYPGFGYGAGGVSQAEPGHLAAIKDDKYAMNSARNLGKRIVQVARIVKAGKEALIKS